jgi:hypothetical protein
LGRSRCLIAGEVRQFALGGQARQPLGGPAFFFERLVQRVPVVGHTERFCDLDEPAVGRDFVMLDLPRPLDNREIAQGTLLLLLGGLLAFGQDALHSLAFDLAVAVFHCRQEFLKALALVLGLLFVLGQRRFEIGRRSQFLELRQRGDNLRLCAE